MRRLLTFGLTALLGCVADADPRDCPEGTVRSGASCVPPTELAVYHPVDAGPTPDAGPLPDAGAVVDAGTGEIALPFFVDEHFAMSGFFPGPPGVVDVSEDCGGVTGTDPRSTCRRITYTPNGATFGGFYFQAPENNWGTEPGVTIEQGATTIRFRAWGLAGGESVKFGAGIDNSEAFSDGWNVETAAMSLGTTPAELSVDISAVTYDQVVGGFLWVIETTDGSTPRTFFLDNIRWE